MEFNKIIQFVKQNNSQSHLCICNNYLFEETIRNGIYGFPHAGLSRNKSFWRSIASLSNIGPKDLIFIYRTNGDEEGCKEIHGPFKIDSIDDSPAAYYDLNSKDFPMKVYGEADCKVRFLFESFDNKVYSISDNFELVKKFETKQIWGYRHPAVMNIGSARKKSITSFTQEQTLVLLNLFQNVGVLRHKLKNNIPIKKRIDYYKQLKNNKRQFKLNDAFYNSTTSIDEAFIYAYMLNAIKNKNSIYHKRTIRDFVTINKNIGIDFKKLLNNALLEIVVTNHLQDELDLVFTDKRDTTLLIMEVKAVPLNQAAITQTEKYLDLMKVIHPDKEIYANIIGVGHERNLQISIPFKNKIKLIDVSYLEESGHYLQFKLI